MSDSVPGLLSGDHARFDYSPTIPRSNDGLGPFMGIVLAIQREFPA